MTPSQIEKAVRKAVADIPVRTIVQQPVIYRQPRAVKERVKVRAIAYLEDDRQHVEQYHATSPEQGAELVEDKLILPLRKAGKKWTSISIYIERI